MSVCSGIQAAFRISQKYWKGYLDPEKMVKTHKKSRKFVKNLTKIWIKMGNREGFIVNYSLVVDSNLENIY